MNEYDYKGYTIIETPDGYYKIDDYEFVSYDEACDWVDDNRSQESEVEITNNKIRTYVLYYVSDDRTFETPIEAHNPQEAKQILWREYDPDANILDYYTID